MGRVTNVKATFSEDIYSSTLSLSTFTLIGDKSGSLDASTTSTTKISYDPATRTDTTLNSHGPTDSRLKACTWYTAKVTSGVKDKVGNLAVEKVWSFKTRGC